MRLEENPVFEKDLTNNAIMAQLSTTGIANDPRVESSRPTMRHPRLTGPGAGSEKYDLLTALAVNGLAAKGVMQSSMMRLMALITARYNWALDEVSMGQKEMARLWSVDERTAKRETKRLIGAGFLTLKRPGVRGRVAIYRLNIAEIYRRCESHANNVGADFRDRIDNRSPEKATAEPSTVVRVQFGNRPANDDAQSGAGAAWQSTLHRLSADHPTLYASWFAPLMCLEMNDHQIQLAAPSRFAAQYISTHLIRHLEQALRIEFGRPMRCEIKSQTA